MNKILAVMAVGLALVLGSCGDSGSSSKNGGGTLPGPVPAATDTFSGNLKVAKMIPNVVISNSDKLFLPAVQLSAWDKGAQTITAYQYIEEGSRTGKVLGTTQSDASGHFTLKLAEPDLSGVSVFNGGVDVYDQTACTLTQAPVLSDTNVHIVTVQVQAGNQAVSPFVSSYNTNYTAGSVGLGTILYADRPLTVSARGVCTYGNIKLNFVEDLKLVRGYNQVLITDSLDGQTGNTVIRSQAFPTDWAYFSQ